MIFDLFSEHMQLFAAITFFIILASWLWYERRKLEIQVLVGIPIGEQPKSKPKTQSSPVMDFQKKGKSIPIWYVLLYRTQLGLKMMEDIANSFPRLIKYISYSGVYICFAGMALIVVSLAINVYKILFQNQKVGAAIVQPFVQTKEGSMFFYVPFFYFIIALFVIVVIHEMSHGIISRLFKVKLKSSGFAFMGFVIPIIPMAFVEPDEKMVNKLKPMQQLAIFAAGPFSNIVLALLIILLLNFVITPFMSSITTTNVVLTNFSSGNTTYPAQAAGIGLGEAIIGLDNTKISDIKSFVSFMEKTKPDQSIKIKTNKSEYDVKLIASPSKSDAGYLGVYVQERLSYKKDFKDKYEFLTMIISWFNELLVWLVMLNIGIGLINLAPLGPIDGGRMLLTVLMIKLPEDKAKLWWGKISLLTLLLLLANIFLPIILSTLSKINFI